MFGMMINTGKILRTLFQCRLKNLGLIFICVTRLHNFCSNEPEDLFQFEEVDTRRLAFIPSETAIKNIRSYSILCDIVVADIQRQRLGRQKYKLDRNS